MYKGYLDDIEGICVGHAQDPVGKTGVTVIIPPKGNACSVDVRGGAPGTRECVLLKPENAVSEVHAIVLSGGSAYGLSASTGVMESLEEDGLGFDVGVGVVPIVPQAVLFDLAYGSSRARPDAEMGKKAYQAAKKSLKLQGSIGAGCGATVGKALGMEHSMKSGIGSASLSMGSLKVSALVAVNAFGDIYDYESAKQIAGVQKDGQFLGVMNILSEAIGDFSSLEGKNTTIGVVATNGIFSKTDLSKISSMAHNGYARSILPVHTQLDGDAIFTLSTNKIEADINMAGILAAKVMSRAISNAIWAVQDLSK